MGATNTYPLVNPVASDVAFGYAETGSDSSQGYTMAAIQNFVLGSYTTFDLSTTVGTSLTRIANDETGDRVSLILQNVGTVGNIAVNPIGLNPILQNPGTIMLAPGQLVSLQPFAPQGVIQAIADTAGSKLTVYDGNRSGSFPLSPPTGGLLGWWDVAGYSASPRAVVPNVNDATTPSHNLMLASRRWFLDPNLWTPHLLTVVDNAVTAPDGSTEASTIDGSGAWNLLPFNLTLSAGTYTVGVNVKWRGSGDAVFALGLFGSTVNKTATGSWGRFSVTFTAPGGAILIGMFAHGGSSVANFSIVDFEIYAGSSDLGPAAPGTHMYVGQPGVTSPTHSGNALDFSSGGAAMIALSAATTLTAATILYVAKKTGAGALPANQGILATHKIDPSWTQWAAVEQNSAGPGFVVGAVNLSAQMTGDLWDQVGAGFKVSGFRYNASTFDAFMDGVQMSTTAVTPASETIRDLDVGYIVGVFNSGYSIQAIALYNKFLSNTEMLQAYNALAGHANADGINIPAHNPEKMIFFLGDSITQGQAGSFSGPGYAYLAAQTVSPVIRGVDLGIAGATISVVQSLLTASVQAYIQSAVASKPTRDVIVWVGLGTNDIGTNPAAFLAAYAPFLDSIRAMGAKVIIPTILSRSDGGAPAGFNANRDSVNVTLRTWVGVHCDAVADFASDATMGPDAASTNATNFSGGLHPTSAGHVLLAPYAVTAINSV